MFRCQQKDNDNKHCNLMQTGMQITKLEMSYERQQLEMSNEQQASFVKNTAR